MPTTYLITGAGRGLGRHLLQAFAVKPNSTVIAAVRNPKAVKDELDSLSNSLPNGSRIIVVKIDSASQPDVVDAVKEIQAQGIDKIDVVIANAAAIEPYQAVQDITVDAALHLFTVNTLGPLLLFQGLRPLLRLQAKFIIISSFAGSITLNTTPSLTTAYAMSKAAVNMLGSRLHVENPELVVTLIHPGWLDTNLGRTALPGMGLSKIPASWSVPIEASTAGIVKIVDEGTRESIGGKFVDQ